MAAGEVMQRQFDPAASSAALAAAQYWKEQQAESMQGERTMSMSRISLHVRHPGMWCTSTYSYLLSERFCWRPGCCTKFSRILACK